MRSAFNGRVSRCERGLTNTEESSDVGREASLQASLQKLGSVRIDIAAELAGVELIEQSFLGCTNFDPRWRYRW